MKIKGFVISEGYDPLKYFLSKGIRIHVVRLIDGYCFIEYEDVEVESNITKVSIIKGAISKNLPSGLDNIFAIDGASNFHWDVQISKEERVTTFIIFWEEPNPNLLNLEDM